MSTQTYTLPPGRDLVIKTPHEGPLGYLLSIPLGPVEAKLVADRMLADGLDAVIVRPTRGDCLAWCERWQQLEPAYAPTMARLFAGDPLAGECELWPPLVLELVSFAHWDEVASAVAVGTPAGAAKVAAAIREAEPAAVQVPGGDDDGLLEDFVLCTLATLVGLAGGLFAAHCWFSLGSP